MCKNEDLRDISGAINGGFVTQKRLSLDDCGMKKGGKICGFEGILEGKCGAKEDGNLLLAWKKEL